MRTLVTLGSCVALFYSGIFWMMVFFVIENRRKSERERKPLEPLAVVLMLGAVYLMLGVVTHPDLSTTFLRPPDATTASVDAERSR